MKYLKYFESEDKTKIEKELQLLLDTMDVPELRKTDLRWLLRNLTIRNSENSNFERVISLIKKLL